MARGHGELLEDALFLWRQTRALVVAELVDQMTASMLLADAGNIASASTPEVFHRRWFQELADPVSRGRAVTQLFDRLPGADDGARADALVERLQSLHRIDPDPRVGHEVVKALVAGHGFLGYVVPLRVAEQVLIWCLDERIRALLTAIKPEDEAVAAVRRLVLLHHANGRKPKRRELDRFATALQPRTAPQVDVGALFAEVYAHPEDDAPRSVLADALGAHGDPRGEFIALQLAGGADLARDKRVQQLIHACGPEWLDELRHLTYRAQFVRGFVARLELAKTYAAVSEELCSNPALATVEELVPGEARGAAYASLLTGGAMTALRRIQIYDRETLEALPEAPQTVVHLSCPSLQRGAGNYLKGLANRVFPACLERGVTSIGISHEGLDTLLKSPLCQRLTSLTLGDSSLVRVPLAWDRVPVREIIVNRWGELEECLGVRVPWLGAFRLVRGKDSAVAHVWGEQAIESVIADLETIPNVASLTVEGASVDQQRRLKTVTTQCEVALELAPAPRRTGYLTITR